MKYSFSVSFLCLCVSIHCCTGEIFSSVAQIEESVIAAKKLTENLMVKARRNNIYIPNIYRVYRQLKGKSGIIKKDPEKLISHPVAVFRLVNDLYKFFNETFHQVFLQTYAEDLVKNLPTTTDLNGTVTGLLRIQETYNQRTELVSRGVIASEASVKLSATECYVIGSITLEQGKAKLGQEWLREAWQRVPEIDRKDHTYIIEWLCNVTSDAGNYKEAAKLAAEWMLFDSKGQDAYAGLVRLKDKDTKPENNKTVKNPAVQAQIFSNYTRLCAEEDWVNPEWRDLRCYVKDNDNPILLFRPLKVEEIKSKPYIVVFHDFVSDFEIKLIKQLSKPKLARSTIRISHGQNAEKDIRISKGMFLHSRAQFLRRLKERVAAATGLNVRKGGEALQVANYGVGGYYIPHYDAWHQKVSEMDLDNRLATVLMYLSDVYAGGATVFPRLELRIKAEKGSVAFWYNLHRNLYIDGFTKHAACPVMVGSKWVANFWIHRYWNEFTRPCTLKFRE